MVSQVSGVYDGIILGAGHNGLVLQAYLLSGRLPAAKSVITGRFPERGITGDISRGCTCAGAAAIREVISPASPATTALKLFWPISACPHRGRPFQRRSV